MPTYPVIHKETGEKKELSMTMVEYSTWRDDLEKLVNGEINLSPKILAGMMFYTKHLNHLALELQR